MTGPDNTAQELCRQLMQAGFGGCRAYVGEKLSYPEERIVSGTVREIAEKIFAPLAVLVVKREKTADDIGNDTVSAKRILRILLRDLAGGSVQKHMVPDFWMTGLSGERFQ